MPYSVLERNLFRNRIFLLFHRRLRATQSRSLRLEGYAIDIDRASFGHQVVEIEVMSSPVEAEIALAGKGIAALARSLGVQGEEGSGRPVKVRSKYFMAAVYNGITYSCVPR